MSKPRLFLCGWVDSGNRPNEERHIVRLATFGDEQNVNVRIEDVAQAFSKDLSPRLEDLLEIAAYLYAADSSAKREGAWTDDAVEPWQRDFRFVIPVKDLSFWQREDVQQLMIAAITFISNDKVSFEFVQASDARPRQGFLEFGRDDRWPFMGVPRVLMFSGGLDSLAGALETASRNENLVLVSHRSVSIMDSRQKSLFSEMKKRLSVPMIRVPVWLNKGKILGRESTQRTRTFLFWALGVLVAESVKADGVRFFENGIVSLNLPIADEVVGARASRTTHPHALHLLGRLGSLITNRDLPVDNPYFFKTKKDIVETLAKVDGQDLIQFTTSCARTGLFRSGTQWHCGVCSQCIDRRIAILAAGQETREAEFDYKTDVFVGPREDGYERNMAINYVRHCVELFSMTREEIAQHFSLEVSRAVRHEERRSEAADQIVSAHKRHAEDVMSMLEEQLRVHAGKLLRGELESSCMLSLVAGQEHRATSWLRFARRIASALQISVPIAFQSEKPKNEQHLQQVCDGILANENPRLVREFPFVRWASSSMKPDWSVEDLRLWLEAKYVRNKRDIGRTEEAIAADVTKYQDADRRALFVIYDPTHAIADNTPLSERIQSREGMFVEFIR